MSWPTGKAAKMRAATVVEKPYRSANSGSAGTTMVNRTVSTAMRPVAVQKTSARRLWSREPGTRFDPTGRRRRGPCGPRRDTPVDDDPGYIPMPPMSGIPPPPPSSGLSATTHSVVMMFLAIEAAF